MELGAILNLSSWALLGNSAWGASAPAWDLQAWSESAASMLIGGLWQGALVACGLAFCLRLAPRIPARMRYGMWAAGFAAVVCLPFLPGVIQLLTSASVSAAPTDSFGLAVGHGPSVGSAAHPLFALDARWSLGLAALWMAASFARAIGLITHAARMRRLWRSAEPVGAFAIESMPQSAASCSRAPAELCVTNDLDRPCVIGFFRPRILIPAWLLDRLTPTELDQVVLHESEHLRRRDDWANLIQKLCLVIFPLNPALWWLERRLCAEREMACDDGVVRRTQAPRAYAACLAGLAEKGQKYRSTLRLRGALSLGAWQRRPELATRVHRLLRRPAVLTPVASWGAVGVVGCGLVAGVVALAHSPQLVGFVAPASAASQAAVASANLLGDQRALSEMDFAQGSSTFAERNAQPFRAVKTIAIVPTEQASSFRRNQTAKMPMSATPASNGSSSQAAADQAQQTDHSVAAGHSLESLVPQAVAAQIAVAAQNKMQPVSQSGAVQPTQTSATQTGAAKTNSSQPGATQTGYLVLTTFEEVQTTGSGNPLQGVAVAGEAGAKTGSETRGAKPNFVQPTTSITVTRMVLRFTEPAAKDSSTSNGLPASNLPPASKTQPAPDSAQPIAIPYRDGWLVIQL